MMLTGDSRHRTQCTIGLGYAVACVIVSMHALRITCSREWPDVSVGCSIQNRQVRKHCRLPSKQSILWRYFTVNGECAGGKQGFVQ
eukprot:3512821-Pyramimonas_sp.AAC.1